MELFWKMMRGAVGESRVRAIGLSKKLCGVENFARDGWQANEIRDRGGKAKCAEARIRFLGLSHSVGAIR